jgi:choline dehydrogenase
MREFGSFDYIIVGAGSAGCVLANRLSASGRHHVLLLEAGGRDINPWIHIPLGYGKLFNEPSVNWLYQTVPQRELNGRIINQPRGKVLGGSSSINGLVYIRGQRQDYDHWRQLGNAGWAYDDVLPYFRKAEDQARGACDYHGAGGPLPVSDQSEPHPLCDAFIAAAVEAGHPSNPDFNGAAQEGAGYYQSTSRRGLRISSAVAYLRPARRRPNLAVVTRAHAARILLDGRMATGVEWLSGGQRFRATATGEVILASGAINTPQLLQLSGIGPGGLLSGHGIGVVHEMPGVGADLQDHLQVRMVFGCTRPITFNDDMRTLYRMSRAGLRYLVQRKGPLTVSAGYAGGIFRSEAALDTPDIQVHFINFSTDKMGDRLHPFSAFTASSCQLRPESRGSVRIVSADPLAPPAIDPNYLATEKDRLANVAGLKLLRRIMQSPAMQPFVAMEREPGLDVASDDALLAYCRERGSTIYHPTCTARMGNDPGAVVDAQLKVRGVGRLRIADGSVMPAVISGNTHAAIVMIGEKASDLILADAA